MLVGTSSAIHAALTVAMAASSTATLPPADDEGFTWHVSARLRYEDRKNFLFGAAGAANDDNFYLPQVRFGLTIPVERLEAFLEGQSAHALGSEAISVNATPNAFEDRFDLHQAYIEHGGVRVGRQKLNYGAQRLVGALEWTNTARTFDGARIRLNHASGTLDLFAAKPVAVQPHKLNDWQRSANRHFASELYGAYYINNRILPSGKAEAYYLVRNSDRFDDTVHTAGVLLQGKAGSTEWNLEGAYQFGRFNGMTHRAYALHGGVSFGAGARASFGAEFNLASGDNGADDSTHETFDNLYPTNHAHYGQMDLFAWMNMMNAAFMGRYQLCDRLALEAEYHWFWLMESETDAWYNASGAVIRTGAAGAGRFVGSELDVRAILRGSNTQTFSIGYSRFFPGSFVDDTGPSKDADFFYVMSQWRFSGK
jgi:hypothetical protein